MALIEIDTFDISLQIAWTWSHTNDYRCS